MKVVAAVDSFKGCVSSMEAGEAVKEGILSVINDADVVVTPLADGGEGTVESLVMGLDGKYEYVDVCGPLNETVKCRYGIIHKENSSTAVIEMAEASGLTLVPSEKRNPLNTTSYGVGEVIKDAIKKGCNNFIIGIGGSATNDGGVGMLQALGFSFKDKNGNEVERKGKSVDDIASIDISGALPELKNCKFNIACDVENPLCGDKGASNVYGPQKGATREIIDFLDNALKNFAELTKDVIGKDFQYEAGAGAAGGLGFGFVAYLNAELKSGIEIILDEINMDSVLKGADFVITGEGSIDFQTSMGKAPVGVAKRAKKYGATVIAIAGRTSDDAEECNKNGIDAYFSIADRAMSLDEAMDNSTAKKNIKKTISQLFRLVNVIKK